MTVLFQLSTLLLLTLASQAVAGPMRAVEIDFHVDITVAHPTSVKFDAETGMPAKTPPEDKSQRNVQGIYSWVEHNTTNPEILKLTGECVPISYNGKVHKDACVRPKVINIVCGSVEHAQTLKAKLESLNEEQVLKMAHTPIRQYIQREAPTPDQGPWDPGDNDFTAGFSEGMESITFSAGSIDSVTRTDRRTNVELPFTLISFL